jgi:hypothetical protein
MRCDDVEVWALALVWVLVLVRWDNLLVEHRRSYLMKLEVSLESPLVALVAVLAEEVVLALEAVNPWDRVDGNELHQSSEEHSQHPTQVWADRLSLSGRP